MPVSFADNGTITSGTTPPSATTVSMSVNNAAGAIGYQVPYDTPVLRLDLGVNTDFVNLANTFSKDSVCFRPEHGCFVTPRHKTNDFKVYPTSNNPAALALSALNTPGVNYTNVVRNYDINSGCDTGVIWSDNDWGSVLISVEGVQVGHTYRLECASCFEYSIGSSSAFAPLSQKTSRTALNEIQMANKIQNSQPIAGPLQSYAM
jgi:hypothetical protein